MAKVRNAGVVIKAVLDKVPESETALRDRLKKIAEDAFFHPPESPTPWADLRDCLNEMIGEPSQPWHHDIIEVVQHLPGE